MATPKQARSPWFAAHRAALYGLTISASELDLSGEHLNLKTSDRAPNRVAVRLALEAMISLGKAGLKPYCQKVSNLPHDLMGSKVPEDYQKAYPREKECSITRLAMMASGRPFKPRDSLVSKGVHEEVALLAGQVVVDLAHLAGLEVPKGLTYDGKDIPNKPSKYCRALLKPAAPKTEPKAQPAEGQSANG